MTATGGNITTINQNGIWNKVHTFLTNGTFTVTNGGNVEYLVVAGGGGSISKRWRRRCTGTTGQGYAGVTSSANTSPDQSGGGGPLGDVAPTGNGGSGGSGIVIIRYIIPAP